PDASTPLTGLAWSPLACRHLVVADERGSLHVWDLHARRTIARWPAHEPGLPVSVAYSADGRFLASAGGTSAKVWDVQRRQEVRQFVEPRTFLRLSWSPDGRLLAGCTQNDRIRIWEPATGDVKATLGTIWWQATTVAFSPDGRRFA